MLIRNLKIAVSRRFCRPEYDIIDSFLIDAGRRKETDLKCRKCGKVKIIIW